MSILKQQQNHIIYAKKLLRRNTMIDVIEINVEEFKNDVYDKYIKLFPKDEQRNWNKIENTVNKGIEKFFLEIK